MYSDAAGAYKDAGKEMEPLDLVSGLELGTGTPRGGGGPSSARSYRSMGSSKGTGRTGKSVGGGAETERAFGAVRLPRPPAQPRANR